MTQKSFYTQKLLHKVAFTQRSLTQRSFYAQTRLHSEVFAFMHKHVYTEKSLHRGAFAHRILYAQTRSHTEGLANRQLYGTQNFYIEQLLRSEACTHRGAFIHRSFYIRVFRHRSFYVRIFLYTDAFTQKFLHRRFYIQKPLHTGADTQKIYTKKGRAVCRLAFGFCGPPCFLFLFFFRPQADRQQGPCPTNYTRLGMTVFHARGQRWSIAARCFPTIRWSFMGFKSDLKGRFRMMTFDYVNIDVVNRTNQKPPIWGG